MNKLQNSSALFFILCVMLLTIVAIGGVWDFFAEDVITKSFQTIGLLATAAVIVIGAGRVMDSRNLAHVTSGAVVEPAAIVPESNPLFTSIRRVVVGVLVVSVSLLALVGVLAIWEVLVGEVVGKSLSTMGIIVFSSVIIVATCLERENHKLLHQNISGKLVFVLLAAIWVMVSLMF